MWRPINAISYTPALCAGEPPFLNDPDGLANAIEAAAK
jgi:hypothetical protein